MTSLKRKDLLGLEDLTREEILLILETARPFKDLFMRSIKKVPTLRGKTVALLFLEPSTRTRASFELAAKRLSADTITFTETSSSTLKGESLLDTVKTLEAMKVDFVILRHASSGAAELAARATKTHVINAGDGSHEHPTQGLLDLYTLKEKLGRLEGLKVTIVGDILHSRVARSNIFALTKTGAQITVSGPPSLIPKEIEQLGVRIIYNLDEALQDADAVNVLRLQLERQKENMIPSLQEYHDQWGLTSQRLSKAKRNCLILHPGPLNRGVEIDSDVADGTQSVITEQVTNGIAIRMAVLYLLTGHRDVNGKIKK